jgi:poly(3-hydroxyalkanoate) synthetase
LIIHSAHVDIGKDDSILAQWIKNFPIDKYASKFDAINSRLINHAFLMRNPVSHFFDNIQYALDMDSNFFEYLASITAWLNNTIDISTEFFKQFTTDLYQRNLLIRNKMNMGSQQTQ